jgi:hypothetical protein
VNTNNRRLVVGGLLSLALLASACGSDSSSSDSTAAPTTGGSTETTVGSETTAAETTAPSNLEATLNASGATFPKTFYEEAIAVFTEAMLIYGKANLRNAHTLCERYRALLREQSEVQAIVQRWQRYRQREADVAEALRVNAHEWRAELPQIEEWFDFIGEKLPTGIRDEFESLKQRLADAD